jgi:hypothetical protein
VTTSWISASIIVGWSGDSAHTFIINKKISYFYNHFHIHTHTWDLHTLTYSKYKRYKGKSDEFWLCDTESGFRNILN